MPVSIKNRSAKDEKQHLETVREQLTQTLKQIDELVKKQANDLQETKKYLYENKAGMDHVEKVSIRQSVNHGALIGEGVVARKNKLLKLLDSPYFGRIDFAEKGRNKINPFYIGIHLFHDEASNANVIYDWRAPVSGIFYDFELGDAYYEAPSGTIHGSISLKRQYRIRKGQMEYMLENAATVYDELLQQELSRSSDDKMKNIVATIQREQNPVVRNETAYELIIQGVAGSGKTSIALHRIAFLLYRYKDVIAAENIMILSPNKVYADYIANVLPELGEEKVPETGMEELAARALDNKIRFQTFFEQVSCLLENKDSATIERLQYKNTRDFLAKLDQYIVHVEKQYFVSSDIWIGKSLVPSWFIDEQFKALHRMPIMKRFQVIRQAIEDNVKFYYKKELTATERKEVLKAVTKMFAITNLRSMYKDFYNWLGKPELFRMIARSKYEYADVFPLIYLKYRFEGIKPYDEIKHLLVDEMQDYSPVQYAVLSYLFPCRKTILGDANQTVNPYGSSNTETITSVFQGADVVKLCKSYRSTYEITRFAQQILTDHDMIAMERHGTEPSINRFDRPEEELEEIMVLIRKFWQSSYQTMGIVCKTQNQAKWLFEQLDGLFPAIHLLSENSQAFSAGIVVTPVHMAKGLEFDQVIVPFVTAENYHTELDRHLLYIACTRAMHELNLTFVNKASGLIGSQINNLRQPK